MAKAKNLWKAREIKGTGYARRRRRPKHEYIVNSVIQYVGHCFICREPTVAEVRSDESRTLLKTPSFHAKCVNRYSQKLVGDLGGPHE